MDFTMQGIARFLRELNDEQIDYVLALRTADAEPAVTNEALIAIACTIKATRPASPVVVEKRRPGRPRKVKEVAVNE